MSRHSSASASSGRIPVPTRKTGSARYNGASSAAIASTSSQDANGRISRSSSSDLETRSGYIVDRGSGILFKPVRHVVFASGIAVDNEGKKSAGFYDDGSDLHFFERAQNPGTVAELEAQEAARANQERAREQAHRTFVTNQPRRTLRLCDFDNDWQMPTVREAARLLLDHGCTLENQDGHLLVQIPEQLDPNGNLHLEAMKHIIRAARVLDAAGPVVLDELAKPKQPKRLDERLPTGTQPPDDEVVASAPARASAAAVRRASRACASG